MARVGLKERFDELNTEPEPMHDAHPRGYKLITSPFWAHMFEREDADASLIPVENRHAFFDLRLVAYLLAIPTVRWCVDKRLMRVAMKGILPDTIRLRTKTPLAGDVLQAMVKRGERLWTKEFDSLPGVNRYVIRSPRQYLNSDDSADLWINVRLLCFYYWMAHTLGAKNELEQTRNYELARM